jgi:hypothetical protein
MGAAACPYCGTALALPGAGGTGSATAPYAPPTVDPNTQAPCANHAENRAEHLCERCGDFLCRLCATPVEGRLYCPRCFDLLYTRGSLQAAQQQFQLPGICFGLGLTSFLASLLCLCINLAASYPLAIAGVWVGLRALREYRARPDLPGRRVTLTGLTFSVLGLLVSLGWTGFWIYTILRRS